MTCSMFLKLLLTELRVWTLLEHWTFPRFLPYCDYCRQYAPKDAGADGIPDPMGELPWFLSQH